MRWHHNRNLEDDTAYSRICGMVTLLTSIATTSYCSQMDWPERTNESFSCTLVILVVSSVQHRYRPLHPFFASSMDGRQDHLCSENLGCTQREGYCKMPVSRVETVSHGDKISVPVRTGTGTCACTSSENEIMMCRLLSESRILMLL
jgi:hypothetical protein